MSQTQKPSIGRIVHYVQYADGDHHAALITAVTTTENMVSLTVFPDSTGDLRERVPLFHISYVPLDSTGRLARTWHWPEREA